MKIRPRYIYDINNGTWCVYEMTYFENGSSGTKVGGFVNKEDAKAEAYRLNGWKTHKTIKDE